MPDPFREQVSLSDPDPEWARQYAIEAARIAHGLGRLALTVEHIGSTSVPLRGKPIIDVQIAVEEPQRAAAVAALEALGYRHHGEGGVAGRSYLTRRAAERPPVNVHVFASESSSLGDNRMIRDYLRTHPDAAAEYAAVKEQALRQGHTDLLAYSHAKGRYVAALRERAWADGTR
jgi:GrpB-like predicted nucleotidyltransferase (UPF0157 family)